MKSKIAELFKESIETKQKFLDDTHVATVNALINALIGCLQHGNKILICGNGGSASDAQHFAGELVGRFQIERKPIAALAIGTDMATLTAISNDMGFEAAYERQVEALGSEGDILFVLSTSGNSPNLLKAVNTAKRKKLNVVGLLGRNGGSLRNLLDISVTVASEKSARIQEVHITLIHIICDILENYFYSGETR